MTFSPLDPRIHAFKPGCADKKLEKRVEAQIFVEAVSLYVSSPLVLLREEPKMQGAVLSQLLAGEEVDCFEEKQGWLWVQAKADHYVGYAERAAFSKKTPDSSYQEAYIFHPLAWLYAAPDIKSPALTSLVMNSRLWLNGKEENGFLGVYGDHWIGKVVLESQKGQNFVDIALQFLHSPYFWGGRSCLGIDCSGLIQMALWAVGRRVPRDTDLQELMLAGEEISTTMPIKERVKHGDLIFWPGHVGIWLEGGRFLHASAYHKRVVIEKFDSVLAFFRKRNLPPFRKIIRLKV